MDVAYPWLSNWICLQWAVHMQWTSAFSAVRGSKVLFLNDFGEDLFLPHDALYAKSAPHPRQPRQHPTTQFFTGRMPFLPPNQQHQSTEGNLSRVET